MKPILIYVAIFWIGWLAAKWDNKYGYEVGRKHGKWIRVNILKLDP